MIPQHYQGNMWMIGFGLFSVFMASQILWATWRNTKSAYRSMLKPSRASASFPSYPADSHSSR
jgi:hypothetical protein